MKKLVILIAIVVAPMYMSAQDAFDSFEFEREVSSVVVTKNMFKLLSQLDLESNDIEKGVGTFILHHMERNVFLQKILHIYKENHEPFIDLIRIKFA